jgi:hypothetical protein
MSSSSSCQQEQLKVELARLKSQAKNLRRRQRRQEAKQQQQAAASPSVTKDVLMVFVLSGHRPAVAAEYANRRSQHSARETSQEARNELEALIEQAYIDTDVDDLASMFDIASSSPQGSLAYRAAKHCVEQKLFEYVVEQNCKKGVAPCGDLLVGEALSAIPARAPVSVRDKLRRELCGQARSVRKWLASFRKRWGHE